MIRLSRYIKKYVGILVLAICFLLLQAALDLNMPNMMSDIVDVGIQKSGIEEIAPKAISQQMMSFMNIFMDEEDFNTVYEAYTPYENLSAQQKEEIDEDYPHAKDEGALVLTAEEDALAAVDTAFGRAGYALSMFIQSISGEQGTLAQETDGATVEMNMEDVAAMIVGADLSQETLDDIIASAKEAPSILTDGIAASINRSIYQGLGADLEKMQTEYILRIGGIMVLLAVGSVVCSIIVVYSFARIGSGVARDIRKDIFAKVNGFSNVEMDKFSTSSLITRTTNDVNQVQMLYTMGMRLLFYAPIMATGGIIMAFNKSPGMSWIIAVGVIILLLIIGTLIIVVLPYFKKMQSLIDRLSQVARENLSGIMVVRAFSNQNFQEERFEKANQNLTKNSLFVGKAMNILMPAMMLVMNGLSLFIIWLGADQVAQSSMQIGDIMAFMQYAMLVVMNFLFIAIVFVMVPRASVSAERIDKVLRSENTICDPEKPVTLGGDAKGVIEFCDVSFRYSGAEEDVLSNISFTAKPGQTTAFIGATGSGKTTLMNLIPRFYDVSGGKVTLDGIDVRELTQHELRENIGYVPQKGLLFSGDVASNIRFGNRDATEEEMREAADIAQASEFIDNMEDGFATAVAQGGTSVSGGQRQRLSIARALAKKAPVYIFDDSFSALDFATDAKLRKALEPYTEKSAVLVVAQRVSTIMNADQIVVLHDGKIDGIGTHTELMKNCDTYREIAESQLSKEELA